MPARHDSAQWTARLTMATLLCLTLLIAWPTCLMPALAPQPAAAAFPGKNGLIAFGSARGVTGNPNLTQIEIFALDPATQQVKRLTDNAVNDYGPAWSPDGKKIAFTRWWLDVGYSIWVMNADGSNQTRLLDGGADGISAPAWSPDGSKIAFARATGGARDSLDVMNANGSNVRTVVTLAGVGEPSWSPDGSKIAFTGNRNAFLAQDIYTVRPDGSNLQNLTPGDTADYGSDPEWSPDGRKLVYSGYSGPASPDAQYVDILVMNADGGGRVNLTGDLPPEQGGPRGPTWSPDGRQILYQGRANPAAPNDQIISMNADGTQKTALAAGANVYGLPHWQPVPSTPRPPIGVVQFPKPALIKTDLIVFSSTRKQPNNPEGDSEIFVMTMNPVTASTTFTQLTANTMQDDEPEWSPDGFRITFQRDIQIWRMNKDGSNQVNLTGTASGYSPTWSPDGAKIAFGRNADIWVMNADGSNQTNITKGSTGRVGYLDWSPDGQKILFSAGTSSVSTLNIAVIDIDGSNFRMLTNQPGDETSPTWSPDSSKIAFSAEKDEPGNRTDIFTMNADSSG